MDLWRCYLEMGQIPDALDFLGQARDIQQAVLDSHEDINITPTLSLIAQCHVKLKDFVVAQEQMNVIWEIIQKNYGYISQSSAFFLVESANIHYLKENFISAVDLLQKALGK